MNYNAIISVLIHKGVLAYDEGEKLAKELANSIVETNFASAHRNVGALLDKIKPAVENVEADIKKVVAKK